MDAIFIFILFLWAVLAFIILWLPSSSVKFFYYCFHFVVWPLFTLYLSCSIYSLSNESYIPYSHSCYFVLVAVRLFIFIL